MTIHLSGKGVNPHWNVPRSLEMLQGLQRAGILLIEELDKHIGQRDSGRGQHPDMMGNATASILVTSYTVEIAIKALHAQTKPNEKPPNGHDLNCLFSALRQATQVEAEHMFKTMPPIGQSDWVGENPDIRGVIKTGRENFVDWRYLPEKQTINNGVPKGLINVSEALRRVCLQHALKSSR